MDFPGKFLDGATHNWWLGGLPERFEKLGTLNDREACLHDAKVDRGGETFDSLIEGPDPARIWHCKTRCGGLQI